MIRSSIWLVLLGVACAAQPADENDPNNGGGATSGASTSAGKGGTSSSSAGTGNSTGGLNLGVSGSGGMTSVGTAGKGGSGGAAAGGKGGSASGDSGGGGISNGGGGSPGTAGTAGGGGRINQKEITARYQAIETGTASPVQHIYGQLRMVNTGGGNAYLKDTRARYYFTNELAPTVPNFEIQLKQLQAPNNTTDIAAQATLVKMPSPTADADTYIEFTFPNDPQILENGKTAIVQFRIFDPAPTQPKFVQSNDYSFNAQTVDTDKIVLYYKDKILWGNEPE